MIEKVKSGEINAFSHIVNRYKQMVFTVILKITGNREEAEDIMQEVFIKTYKSITKFQGKSEFSTWLYRIAYNTTLSHIRQKRIEYISYNGDTTDILRINDLPQESKDEENEDLKYLEIALKKLKPEESLLITFFYLNDFSVEQISKITNFSVSNIKVKLHRIRKKLNSELNNLKQIHSKL